jgi:hypothetical protein
MRVSSRFVGILTSLAMVLPLASPANADDTDGMPAEQIANLRQQLPTALYDDIQNGHKFIGVAFAGGSSGFGNQASYIRHLSFERITETKLCQNYTDYSCFGFGPNEAADALVSLPPCLLDSSTSCIEGLTITRGGQKIVGNFLRVVDNTVSPETKAQEELNQSRCCSSSVTWGPTTWPGIPAKNLPTPTPPSIWQVTGASHKGGAETYLTSASLNLRLFKNGSVEFVGMQSEVLPFSEISGEGFHPPAWIFRTSNSSRYFGHFPFLASRPLTSVFNNPTSKNTFNCAYEESGKCGLAYQFADGSSAELTLRLPRDLGGWFYGRLANTELKLDPMNNKLNRVTISGEPVNAPISSGQFQLFAPENERFRNYVLNVQYKNNPVFQSEIRQREASGEGGLGSWGNWEPSQGLNEFRNYEPLMGDRAKGQVQMWSVNTLPAWQTDNPCFADKTRVQGILTTNAMVYQAGLPTFSKGQLSYQVAGLHNNFDGSVFNGEYTLQMRADDARCLYGYSEAPIQTKVSVTDSGGTQKIATTSVSERGGWLTIRARNFTFSSPKIVVAIKQGKKSKAASTASVSIRKGKSLSAKTLMSEAKIKAKNGDRLDISVVGSKTTGVTDAGKSLKFKSKGTYYVKVVVTRKNSSATSRVFKVVVK